VGEKMVIDWFAGESFGCEGFSIPWMVGKSKWSEEERDILNDRLNEGELEEEETFDLWAWN
jgi:hypothetical protein